MPFATFVQSLVVQALSSSGSLGGHVRTMSGVNISDAAVHERRQGLAWDFFEELNTHILRPRARRDLHPDCFYQGHRLLAVDGSWWSLRNTRANIAAAPPRHGNQKKASSAFLKWGTAVLLEVGTHQPLAAARTLPGLAREEGELNIARRVLCAIPREEDTLLLADRLYGNGCFISDVQTAAAGRAQVLVRVPKHLKSKVIEVLSDGSALIEIKVKRKGIKGTRKLKLREVRGQVWRGPGARDEDGNASGPSKPEKTTEVRLWTTLLDEKKHPAGELLALYSQRWEQELFFRELKRHTGREHLVRAGTVQGAEAEYGAMIIAASLLAEQRVLAAKQAGLPLSRLSIARIGRAMEALLPVLSVAGELINAPLREKIIARFMAHTAREARIPPRRTRSCQRGLRKPVCAWERIRAREYLYGPCLYAIIPVVFP